MNTEILSYEVYVYYLVPDDTRQMDRRCSERYNYKLDCDLQRDTVRCNRTYPGTGSGNDCLRMICHESIPS